MLLVIPAAALVGALRIELLYAVALFSGLLRRLREPPPLIEVESPPVSALVPALLGRR